MADSEGFQKYPGMKIGPFRRSDGNGGSKFDVSSIIEKAISGVISVVLISAITTYTTVKFISMRQVRIESAIIKIGKVVCRHVDPSGAICSFDDFDRDAGEDPRKYGK